MQHTNERLETWCKEVKRAKDESFATLCKWLYLRMSHPPGVVDGPLVHLVMGHPLPMGHPAVMGHPGHRDTT